MVGTIAPLVKEAPGQWLMSIIVFTSASTMAGASLGWLLGVAGSAVRQDAWLNAIAIATAGLILVVVDAGNTGHVASLGRSVPQDWWKTMGRSRGALAYGLVLGLGFTTIVPFATFYVLPVAALVLGPAAGAVVGFNYGFARAVPVWFASMAMKAGADPVAVGAWPLGGIQRVLRVAIALAVTLLAGGLLARVI